MSDNLDRLAYTVSGFAEAMEVSRPTVYKWMRLPGFPVLKIGGCTRIPARAAEQWLNKKTEILNDCTGA